MQAALTLMADWHNDGMWAKAFGDGHGLRRVTAEGPGFIGSGGDHTPRPVITDQHGLALEFGMIHLFDGGKEGVHVEVEDGGSGWHAIIHLALEDNYLIGTSRH